MDNSKLAGVKKQLLHELSADVVNTLKVRELCRDHPGLIATAGLRVRIWSLLLLGDTDIRDSEQAPVPETLCAEQQVLEADVRRTRGDVEQFRSDRYQEVLTRILQGFCVKHNVEYKQGMNEILAPFIQVNPPPSGTRLTFSIYEAFLFRYLERFFCRDESSFLFKGFRMFHLLLMYVDPQLGEHLAEQNFFPELYAPQWFLTVYSRGLPLPLVLRLWDMLIAVDDPAFNFFIGLCMLREHRAYLIMSDVDAIPEIISGIKIKTEAEVDKLVLDALEIYRLTPRCFLRAMRLCAVSSTQLAPKPMRRSSKSKSMNRIARSKWNNHDETMAKQAIRHCVTLSANELVSKLCPVEETKPGRSSPRKLQRASSQSSPGSPTVSESLAVIIPRSNSDLSTDNSTLSDLPNIATSSVAADQIVMIDLRSDEDTDGNGGGTIAKAIRLSPACLKDTNMLAKWLQHFDGIKGCVICVIDMPPVQAPEVALWRRLLLGEGDGFAPGSINYGGSYEFDGLDVSQTPRDFESPFVKLEDATIKEDAQRVGMKFVLELQKSGFPYVSLLDGGFPSLVEALFNLRGTVEPVIIQHNVEAWQQYLRYSGRGQVILPLGSGNLDGDSSDDSESVTSSNKLSSSCRGKSSLLAKSISRPQCSIKKVKDMNELERSKTAYNVAVSLKHDHMAAILKIKIMG